MLLGVNQHHERHGGSTECAQHVASVTDAPTLADGCAERCWWLGVEAKC